MPKKPNDINVKIEIVKIECFEDSHGVGECNICGEYRSLQSRTIKAKLTTLDRESYAWFMLGDICYACAKRVESEVL
jgi:hypothetical protein